MPKAPEGFAVYRFASGLDGPRTTLAAPNGDILVAESKADQITIFRDADGDGNYETRKVFLDGLNKPFGMLILGGDLYVANTDAVVKYPYDAKALRQSGPGVKIVALPSGGRHWTRNIVAGPDGDKLYIAVGSSSNVAEDGIDKEIRRADILEINPDGTGERVYANGMRNPVGMDWNPVTHELWAAVNERDELGDDLVPDYITSVRDGAFYGWPYSYYGSFPDPRLEGQGGAMREKATVPDIPVGSHTATLGLAFDKGRLSGRYKNGVFAGQHGSWNRSKTVGYKVIFIPFENGKPAGKPEDFLTGFISDTDQYKAYGRPVGVTQLKDGSLLICDDGSGTIWKVSPAR
jgi:glucose/arabinose dehydrogenase